MNIFCLPQAFLAKGYLYLTANRYGVSSGIRHCAAFGQLGHAFHRHSGEGWMQNNSELALLLFKH